MHNVLCSDIFCIPIVMEKASQSRCISVNVGFRSACFSTKDAASQGMQSYHIECRQAETQKVEGVKIASRKI